MPHPINACADCDHVCDEGERCIHEIGPDEDRAYDEAADRQICEKGA